MALPPKAEIDACCDRIVAALMTEDVGLAKVALVIILGQIIAGQATTVSQAHGMIDTFAKVMKDAAARAITMHPDEHVPSRRPDA